MRTKIPPASLWTADPHFLDCFMMEIRSPITDNRRRITKTGMAVPIANTAGSVGPNELDNIKGIARPKNNQNIVGQKPRETVNPSRKA